MYINSDKYIIQFIINIPSQCTSFLRDIHEYYDCSKKKVEEYPAKNKIGCYFINNFLQRMWEKTLYFCSAGKAEVLVNYVRKQTESIFEHIFCNSFSLNGLIKSYSIKVVEVIKICQ